MAVALDFDYDNRVITVLSPDIQVTCQELVNLIAAERATALSLDDFLVIGGAGNETGQSLGYQSIARWEGKSSLGQAGEFTGLTVTLLAWRLDFQEFTVSGPLEALVLGGNLLAVDINGNSVNPIVSTVNVATIAQAVSATLSVAQANKQMQRLIESGANQSHFGTGDIFYVDPVFGDDTFDGLLPEQPSVGSKRGPKKTFAAAHALAVDGHHDIIQFEQNQTGGPTVLTETIDITKEDLHLRGPGPNFHIAGTDNTEPVIKVTADHVSMHAFRVKGFPAGSANSVIECIGTTPLIKDVHVQDGNSHGVLIRSTALQYQVLGCSVHDNAGTGVRAESAMDGQIGCLGSTPSRIYDNDIGIHLEGTADAHVFVDESIIYNQITKGMRIDSGIEDTFITARARFSDNGTGQIGGADPTHDLEDSSTTTHYEAPNLNRDDRDDQYDKARLAAALAAAK